MIILKQSCEVVIRMCVGVFLSRSYRILVMSATITKVFKLDKLLSQRGCSNFCTNPTGMGSAQASAGSRLGVCGYSDSSDRTSTLRRQAKWTSHAVTLEGANVCFRQGGIVNRLPPHLVAGGWQVGEVLLIPSFRLNPCIE